MKKEFKTIDTLYEPRPWAAETHPKLKRFSAICAHRRCGKTEFAINHAINEGIYCRFANPNYGFISPLLSQSKRNAWETLKKYTKPFPKVETNENELRVDIWRRDDDRIRIQLFGAENPDAIAGFRMDGSILDETQDHNPTFFGRIIRPMLSDRRGWALFIGTVRGRNYFYKLRERYREKMLAGDPDYFEAEFKASQTGILSKEELQNAREELGDELYMQEFELSPESPNKGSYYGNYLAEAEKEGRITSVPYEPSIPVGVMFDLGIDDSTAMWFYQILGREVRFIEYLEESGKGIPEICGTLRQRPYAYDELVLPHDAAVRELGTGKSREEVFRSQRFRTRIVPRQSIADGIQAVRLLLPRAWFDKLKCHKGLDALREYQRMWNEKEGVFESHPKHDWSSHGADSIRTGAMGMKENRVDQSKLPRFAETEYDIW